MTDNTGSDLDSIHALFETHDIFAHPSEIHGVITGLLCGGCKVDDEDWLGPISDFFHQGLNFPDEIVEQLELMYKLTWQTLMDDNMPFVPLLPNDEEVLTVRATAMSGWTQGFLLGFGTNKLVLSNASDDVNEVIQDFAEISKMTSELEENEENESAFFEVHEYVRISTIMCFAELGDNPLSSRGKITLH